MSKLNSELVSLATMSGGRLFHSRAPATAEIWPLVIFQDGGHLGSRSIRSADLENPTLEPNMKSIGLPLPRYGRSKFSKMWVRLLVGRSVVNIYIVLMFSSLRQERSARGVKTDVFDYPTVVWHPISMEPLRIANWATSSPPTVWDLSSFKFSL